MTQTALEKARLTTVGRFGVGTSANTSGDVSAKLHICDAGRDYGGEYLTAVFQDTSNFGINQGGAIGFSAWRDDDNTDAYAFGAISGRKEDATTGNEQGYLTLFSRPISTFKSTPFTGGALGKLQEVIRITSARNVGIGTQSPAASLEIKGTLSTFLSDTTSTSSGTGNKTIASTSHGLEVGDSVALPSGGSDLMERFTVASVTDANTFVVDSNLTGAITDKQGYKDSDLLSIKNADDVSKVLVDSSGRVGINASDPGVDTATQFEIRGNTGTGFDGAGKITLSTAETTVVDNDVLGIIAFQAPKESGSDARLPAAAIWAESEATFTASVNSTALVFSTATSGQAVATAQERMRIDPDGHLLINVPYAALDAGNFDVILGVTDPESDNGRVFGSGYADYYTNYVWLAMWDLRPSAEYDTDFGSW